jgi:hypothetical protein
MLSAFRRTFSHALVALCLTFVSFAALADPPGRVARLGDFVGDVRVASNQDAWLPAYRNYVVTAGDNLWVSDGGRAELDVGPLSVWLSGGANIYFERFDDHNLVGRLASGSVAVRIRQWESRDAMRIATSQGEVALVEPGLYIVSAGDGYNPSVVVVRYGRADLNTRGRLQPVNGGDTIAFDQNGARFDRFAYSGSPSGGFEAWVASRDRRIDRWEQRNRGYYNPWMVGVRDLDDHGYWETSYEYGRVWYPRAVSVDWAPYRQGRWTWVQPWGWTWVDDASWGFAPFHYGRWVRLGGRWAWCPGSYTERAVYAPALVSFYGGGNWSVNVSVGPTYSWVPLGWNEPYVPWYTYTPNYWRHVNRPYVRNVAEDPWRPPAYINAAVPGAITTVAVAALVGGRPVAQNFVRNVAVTELRSAPPARMGEVVPQFAVRGRRQGEPAPAVGNAPTSIPGALAMPPSRGAGPATAGMPQPVQPTVRERAPVSVQPNLNVAQPRVWQDPNPVAPRGGTMANPVAAPVPMPTTPAAPVVREAAPARAAAPATQYQAPPVTAAPLPMPPGNPNPNANPYVRENAPRAPQVREAAPQVQRGVAPPAQPQAQPQMQTPPVVVPQAQPQIRERRERAPAEKLPPSERGAAAPAVAPQAFVAAPALQQAQAERARVAQEKQQQQHMQREARVQAHEAKVVLREEAKAERRVQQSQHKVVKEHANQ